MILSTVEMHTGGEPTRIVVDGWPRLEGRTLLDKRRETRERFDHLRRGLMFEPRGHDDMYGVLPVEPDLPEADLAVLFMHNEGYSARCAATRPSRWPLCGRQRHRGEDRPRQSACNAPAGW
jgi:proline racemase